MQNSRFPQITDEQLVVAALLGDLDAFDELVRRFRGAVRMVAGQVLRDSPEAAEDVVQEAFLLAFKALPQLQDPAKFGGWLCAIARHRARRVASQSSRVEATAPPEMDRLLVAHSRELSSCPAQEYARRSERDRVAEAVASLAPEHRTVLELRYFEEWPIARIADFLSLPITTVKWRLYAARTLLRRHFLTEQKREDDTDDRKRDGKQQHRRDQAAAPPAARDRRHRPACEPDGQPGRGRFPRRAAL